MEGGGLGTLLETSSVDRLADNFDFLAAGASMAAMYELPVRN
jgi:hypothetical protein